MKNHNFAYYRIIIGFVCLLPAINIYSQWPQWRGPMRDGISKEENLLKIWPKEGPRLVWSVDTVGDGFSSTAIQDQMVYTIGKHDSVEVLTALDVQGNLKWQKVFGRACPEKEWPQSRSTPTVYKNKVYVVSSYGDVACIDGKSGNINWKIDAFEKFWGKGYSSLVQGIAESPLVVDDKLIITPCGANTTMVALNRLTGKTIWSSESINDTVAFTSPLLLSVKNKKAIFTSTKKNDLLVDCNSGKILWKEKNLSVNTPLVPLMSNNKVYYPGPNKQGGRFYSWNDDLNKRSVVWEDTISANILGGAVLLNNKIIVSGSNRGLNSLDLTTGKVLSHYDKISYSNLIVADNMLYCYEDRTGKVFLFKMDGNNFELVSSFKITSGTGPRIAHMSIANGLLFIRHGKVLMAYDLKGRS